MGSKAPSGKRFKATAAERKRYVLSKNTDLEILARIKELEKAGLTSYDKHLIKLMRTQLEADWRKPLLKELERLLKKYRKELPE
jgi:hypothetical protein